MIFMPVFFMQAASMALASGFKWQRKRFHMPLNPLAFLAFCLCNIQKITYAIIGFYAPRRGNRHKAQGIALGNGYS